MVVYHYLLGRRCSDGLFQSECAVWGVEVEAKENVALHHQCIANSSIFLMVDDDVRAFHPFEELRIVGRHHHMDRMTAVH